MIGISVYEYITASQAERGVSSLSASLLREGRAMLDAVVTDLSAIPEVSVRVAVSESELLHWADKSDYTMLIAPEFHSILLNLATKVRAEGGTLLGSNPPAIRLASDKLRLGQAWQASGIFTPGTRPYDGKPARDTIIVKPRDGAGSQATRLLQTGECFEESWQGDLISQEFVEGMPASVALLCGPAGMLPLNPCEQLLTEDGRFTYLGGRLIRDPKLVTRAHSLALRAASCVSGLFGYVGIDLILGSDGRDWAIEINPRLTTSYVGLRAMTDSNLMAAMLSVARGETTSIKWKSGESEFTPEGRKSN